MRASPRALGSPSDPRGVRTDCARSLAGTRLQEGGQLDVRAGRGLSSGVLVTNLSMVKVRVASTGLPEDLERLASRAGWCTRHTTESESCIQNRAWWTEVPVYIR